MNKIHRWTCTHCKSGAGDAPAKAQADTALQIHLLTHADAHAATEPKHRQRWPVIWRRRRQPRRAEKEG